MEQINALLANDLTVLLGPMLLGTRALWTWFLSSQGLPTLPKWTVPLMLAAVGFGLAWGNASIHPEAPTTVSGLWWVQGALFFVGLLLGDKLTGMVYTTSAVAKGEVTPT